MKDLRLIALCNVLYKIIAKVVLANRLKVFLPDLIDEAQSAFVLSRAITDNAIATFEIVHYMKSKKKGKDGEVAVTIDINKAYDIIKWDYLEGILLKMGFADTWVQWIMLCVTMHGTILSLNKWKFGRGDQAESGT